MILPLISSEDDPTIPHIPEPPPLMCELDTGSSGFDSDFSDSLSSSSDDSSTSSEDDQNEDGNVNSTGNNKNNDTTASTKHDLFLFPSSSPDDQQQHHPSSPPHHHHRRNNEIGMIDRRGVGGMLGRRASYGGVRVREEGVIDGGKSLLQMRRKTAVYQYGEYHTNLTNFNNGNNKIDRPMIEVNNPINTTTTTTCSNSKATNCSTATTPTQVLETKNNSRHVNITHTVGSTGNKLRCPVSLRTYKVCSNRENRVRDVPATPQRGGGCLHDKNVKNPSLVLKLSSPTTCHDARNKNNNAGEQTPDLHSFPTQRFTRDETLIFFDWDDTLLPSSWLASRDLTLEAKSVASKEEKQYLDSIAISVCQVLEFAVQHGRVVIVTNAESGWVELSAAKYMPTVLEVLEAWHISVISARSEFESLLFQHPVQWKVEAFKQLIALAFSNASLNSNNSSQGSEDDNGKCEAEIENNRSEDISTDGSNDGQDSESPSNASQSSDETEKDANEAFSVLGDETKSLIAPEEARSDDDDLLMAKKEELTKDEKRSNNKQRSHSCPPSNSSCVENAGGNDKGSQSVGRATKLLRRTTHIKEELVDAYLRSSSRKEQNVVCETKTSNISNQSSPPNRKTSDSNHCSKNILSFGDSDSERVALIVSTRHMPQTIYKSFKLCEHPSPLIVLRQLQLVHRLFDAIVHHKGKLDLKINFKLSAASSNQMW